jgi:hypothetical protein
MKIDVIKRQNEVETELDAYLPRIRSRRIPFISEAIAEV